MNHILSAALTIVLVLSSCADKTTPAPENENRIEETTTPAAKQLRHVVLFKFKESSSAEDIQKVVESLSALPSQIAEIKSYEWGINNSPEGFDKGFTHCFLLTFDSEEDRDTYLPHPAHQAFGELATPHIDDVLVVDYWIN